MRDGLSVLKTGTLTHKMAAFTGSVSIHAKFAWKQDEDQIRAGGEGKSKLEQPKFQGLCHQYVES